MANFDGKRPQFLVGVCRPVNEEEPIVFFPFFATGCDFLLANAKYSPERPQLKKNKSIVLK